MISLSNSLELIFLDLFTSASSLLNLDLSSSKLFFRSCKTELNLPWWSSYECNKSPLFSFIKDDPTSCLKFKKSIQISTTKYSNKVTYKHTRPLASYVDKLQ